MNSDSVVEKLTKQIRKTLVRHAVESLLQEAGMAEVEVEVSQASGASGAIMFEAKILLHTFLKLDYNASASDIAGFHLLREAGGTEEAPGPLGQHVVGPLFDDLPEGFMLVPFLKADTWHAAVCKGTPQKKLLAVHDHFLDTLRRVWSATRTPREANLDALYTDRVANRLDDLQPVMREAAGDSELDARDLEVVVNRQSMGTIGAALDELEERLHTFSGIPGCTIHGDENPKNLLVSKGAPRPSDWKLIDYVNARSDGDWIFSIAKMKHWWDFYCVLELAKDRQILKRDLRSSYTVNDSHQLIVEYDEGVLERHRPPLATRVIRSLGEFLDETADHFSESPNSAQQRLRLALFAVTFGSAPLQFDDPSLHHGGPVMIGEAFRYLKT